MDGQTVSLSPLEFRFLMELCRQRGKLVPHEHLLELLWEEVGPSSRQCLKQLVHRLRLHLGEAGEAIVSIPGIGYILHA